MKGYNWLVFIVAAILIAVGLGIHYEAWYTAHESSYWYTMPKPDYSLLLSEKWCYFAATLSLAAIPAHRWWQFEKNRKEEAARQPEKVLTPHFQSIAENRELHRGIFKYTGAVWFLSVVLDRIADHSDDLASAIFGWLGVWVCVAIIITLSKAQRHIEEKFEDERDREQRKLDQYLGQGQPQTASPQSSHGSPPSTTFGSDDWASYKDIACAGMLKFTPRSIYIGQAYNPNFGNDPPAFRGILYNGDAHLITTAETGSGKFRDVLASAMMCYPGSLIVVDPKLEAACVTRRSRLAHKNKVMALNPFHLFPDKLGAPATYNPMDTIDANRLGFGADCDSLAEAIVPRNDKDSQPHFADSARGSLVSGVIQQLIKNGEPEFRNLGAVRSLIAGPSSNLKSFCQEAVRSGDQLITDKLARFAEMNDDDREIRAVISTARTQTDFLGNEAIRRSVQTSSFRFANLKKERTTIYIGLPTEYLTTCGKWFRLIIAGALHELLQQAPGDMPVLAILDEFANLGRLGAIETAMSIARGYGLRLWPILQRAGQAKELYGDAWEGFYSAAGVRQFFAPREMFTAEYISKLCGVTTVQNVSRSSSDISMGQVMHGFSGVNLSRSETQRPLLFPTEVMKLDQHEQLLFIDKIPHAYRAVRQPYNTMGNAWAAEFDPNPYHKPN